MRFIVLIVFMVALVMGKGIDYESYCRAKYKHVPYWLIMKVISNVSREVEIDPWLLYSVIEVESNFDVCATSYAGAVGLMQILPSTAKLFEPDITIYKLYNPVINIRIGAHYLKALINYYNHLYKNPRKALFNALLAYNAGPRRKKYAYLSLKYSCKVLRIYGYRSGKPFYPRICRYFN